MHTLHMYMHTATLSILSVTCHVTCSARRRACMNMKFLKISHSGTVTVLTGHNVTGPSTRWAGNWHMHEIAVGTNMNVWLPALRASSFKRFKLQASC